MPAGGAYHGPDLALAVYVLHEAVEKIYPAIAEMNRVREEHREAMQEKMKKLHELIEEEKTKDAAKLADEIHELRGEMHAAMHENEGKLMQMLSEEQRAEVRVILEHHQEEVSALWRDMRPQYEVLQEQARAEIREVLNDEQRATYEELLERQRERGQRDSDRERGNARDREEETS